MRKLLFFVTFFIFTIPVFAQDEPIIPACTASDIAALSDPLAEFSSFLQRIDPTFTMVTPDTYQTVLDEIDRFQGHWWEEITPLLPQCTLVVEISQIVGRATDELMITLLLSIAGESDRAITHSQQFEAQIARLQASVERIETIVGQVSATPSVPAEASGDLGIIAATVAPTAVVPPVAPTLSTQQILTSKGNFTVPGYAFMDGRDFEASPPLTVMTINIWDTVPRQRVVCTLQHGTQVALLEAKLLNEEARYYFLVNSGMCQGWVPDVFLSVEHQDPIGDQF